ncbi:MAG: hypothetical protein ABI626_00960 [Sphingomicrobium sp.]
MNAAGWVVSFFSGAALWSAAAMISGHREPWDATEYWTIYLPAAYLLCGLLGFAFPRRTWRWPLAVMFAQFPVMLLPAGQIGSMVGAGIVMALILSLPGMIVAAGAGAIRRRFTSGTQA